MTVWRTNRVLQRRIAALTAFACLWLSALGPFLHTDSAVDEVNAHAALWRVASAPAPADTGLHASHATPHDRCLACEFQANSVCVALTPFIVAKPANSAPPLTCAAARAASVPTFSTSSRAPPAA